MEQCQKEIIDLQQFTHFGGEDLKQSLREVRALIVYLLGGCDSSKTPIIAADLSNALYTLQVLIEETEYKD